MAQCNTYQSSTLGITVNSPITFELGQRRCGPPPNWTAAPPGKGCEIFIAKIPKDCFERELIPILEKMGKIYTFRLMMENESSHRGFGFCVYTKHETAKEAVVRLNNYQIKKNWYLGVCFSVDNCRLFVGGIPKLKTKVEIHKEVSSVTENVVDIIVYPSAADKNKNRGFAFVEYTNHKAAAIARKKMISNGIQLWGHTVAVDWAEPERKVEDEIMIKVKILYVRNLMLTTTEDTIYRAFSQHINDPDEIIKVKKIGDFAFVHFRNREQAEIVKNQTHGMNLEGSTIEVHFAKPVNKLEQQQKLLKKSNSNLTQSLPLMLANEFNSLSISSNGNNLPSPDNIERNGLNTNRSYRNAAGRCSIKSKQLIKHIDNNENVSNNYTALLTQICQKHGWGIPFYTIQFVPMMLPNSENSVQLFLTQVYIPGLNCHFPSRFPAFTHEEGILRASETALLWMYYNGIQILPFLGNSEKPELNTKTETPTRKLSDNELLHRNRSNSDSAESVVINNTNIMQASPSQLYMPQLLQCNTFPYYFNNYSSENSFYPTSEINEFSSDSQDQNLFSSQTFHKN